MSHTSKRFLERRLRKKVGQAIHDYRMIEPGDKVLVAISGGKDSIVMMKILVALKEAAPLEFELIPAWTGCFGCHGHHIPASAVPSMSAPAARKSRPHEASLVMS